MTKKLNLTLVRLSTYKRTAYSVSTYSFGCYPPHKRYYQTRVWSKSGFLVAAVYECRNHLPYRDRYDILLKNTIAVFTCKIVRNTI